MRNHRPSWVTRFDFKFDEIDEEGLFFDFCGHVHEKGIGLDYELPSNIKVGPNLNLITKGFGFDQLAC